MTLFAGRPRNTLVFGCKNPSPTTARLSVEPIVMCLAGRVNTHTLYASIPARGGGGRSFTPHLSLNSSYFYRFTSSKKTHIYPS